MTAIWHSLILVILFETVSTLALLIREHCFIFNDILTVSVLVGSNFRFANDITLNNNWVDSTYINIYILGLFFFVRNYLFVKKEGGGLESFRFKHSIKYLLFSNIFWVFFLRHRLERE